jgi:hypothetical protein
MTFTRLSNVKNPFVEAVGKNILRVGNKEGNVMALNSPNWK